MLTSDYLRQRALYALQDLVTRFLTEDSVGAEGGPLQQAVRILLFNLFTFRLVRCHYTNLLVFFVCLFVCLFVCVCVSWLVCHHTLLVSRSLPSSFPRSFDCTFLQFLCLLIYSFFFVVAISGMAGL